MKNRKGILFVISGPSGSGKGTVIAEVLAKRPNTFFSVSMTTRSPRPGEVDGVSYLFTDADHFRQLIDEGGLLEYAQYVDNYYGTPLKPLQEHLDAGDDVILDIETAGAMQIKKLMPDAVLMFLCPSDLNEVENRLRRRGTEKEETIKKRLETARKECTLIPEYKYLIINDDLSEAVNEVMSVMCSEHCRVEKRSELPKI